MSPLGQIVLAGIGTYLLRISFIVLLARVETIPARVELALRMIPPAVLGAIVAQGLLLDDGALRGPSIWHVTAVIAGLVGWRTRNTLATIVVGMGTLWTLSGLT